MLKKVKKLVAILLLTIYTSNAIGIAINFHYCQGHLEKISFLNFGEQKGCACNPQDMPKGCCKDNVVYQKTDKHNIVQPVSIVELISFDIESPYTNNYSFAPYGEDYISDFTINAGLRCCSQPIFLLNRVFRI